MINYSTPDLTQHPPRSVRVRLGGFVHLCRLLDKSRAIAAGKNGDYKYNCPLDQRFFAFTGINADEFLTEVKTGKTDAQMLEWVNAKANKPTHEVIVWSAWLEQHGPGGAPGHEWAASVIKGHNSPRDDIRSFADLLDFDDYHSFGGKA